MLHSERDRQNLAEPHLRPIRRDPRQHLLPPPMGCDRQSLTEPHQPPLIRGPPQNFLPSTIERDQQILAELYQRAPPPLDVVKDANGAFPPLMPSVAYRPLLGHAEPSELEQLAPTLAPAGVVSEEDYALLHRHNIIHDGFRLVMLFH